MSKEKRCPKCSEVNMEPLSLSIAPFTVETKFGSINIGDFPVGLPIQAYECPECGMAAFFLGPSKLSFLSFMQFTAF